jgi:hypothetical protein
MLSNELRQTIAQACVTLQQSREQGGGQGVLIPGNFILTAAHCVLHGPMTMDDFIPAISPRRSTGALIRTKVYDVQAVADIAVLGAMDGQGGGRSSEECEKFEAFCEATTPLPVYMRGLPFQEKFPIYLYTHTEEWVEGFAIQVWRDHPVIWLEVPCQIQDGTAGSPIVTEEGAIVGIVSSGFEHLFPTRTPRCKGRGAVPSLALPAWLVQDIKQAQDQERPRWLEDLLK